MHGYKKQTNKQTIKSIKRLIIHKCDRGNDKHKQILNMHVDLNTDQLTATYHSLSAPRRAATSLSQWTRASAPRSYPPAARSSLGGTRWRAAPCPGSQRLRRCAVSHRSRETPAACAASACSPPQNSPPALGPTRPIFCSATGRCACCVWKRRLCAIKSRCGGKPQQN